MAINRKYLTTALLSALMVSLCLPPLAAAASAAKRGSSGQSESRDITRKGNTVFVSRGFAEAVKKDNAIIMSTVAVKSRVDKEGRLNGFQLFQIDRGSPVISMGFKAKDILTNVNGIPAGELEANRQALEREDAFVVTVLRSGKEQKIRILIR